MRVVFVALGLATLAVPAAAQSCADRIAFVHKVIDNDLKVNFIGKDVHAAMKADLDAAEQACKAGDAGKADSIVSATQSKHGYPVR